MNHSLSKVFSFILLLTMFISAGAQAQTDTSDNKIVLEGTLKSYVAYAMDNSPALEAQFERWQGDVYSIAQARRLPDPVISYSYYIKSVETRVGPQKHKVSLKQTFPWPSKLSAGADAAALKANAAKKKFNALAISIKAAVEKFYWSLWVQKEIRKVHEEHVLILDGLSESAGALLMTGKINLADQQQINLTAARVADLLNVTDEQMHRLESGLKGVMGAPRDTQIKILSSPLVDRDIIDKTKLLESVKNHPYINSYEDLALASEFEAKKEQTSRYPDFTLGVDWIITGDTSNLAVADSGQDAVIVGLGIAVPLWQGNYKKNVQAKESLMRAFRAEGDAARDSSVASFYTILSNMRDAKRRIELYKNTLVPQAKTVFESVLGSYTTGRSDVASVLLAQQDLLELRIELIEARGQYAIQKAELENVAGHEITHMSKTEDAKNNSEGKEIKQ